MTKALLRFLPALLWMGVIFFLSHQGSESSDQQSGLFVALLTPVAGTMDMDILTTIVRKSAHFSAYLILGLLLFWGMKPSTQSVKKSALLSISIAALFAVSDEFHQYFIPGRSSELRDVIIDTLGATLGVLIAWLVLHLRWRRIARARASSAHAILDEIPIQK